MWSDRNSVLLSKACVLFFAVALLGTVVFAPNLVRWLLTFSRAPIASLEVHFLATIYGGSLFAALLLYHLFRLLERIAASEVFTAKNAARLRYMSWLCAAGALLAFVSSFYYRPWILVSVPAAFMSLILRVVKNVVEKAVALQQEVDYTV